MLSEESKWGQEQGRVANKVIEKWSFDDTMNPHIKSGHTTR